MNNGVLRSVFNDVEAGLELSYEFPSGSSTTITVLRDDPPELVVTKLRLLAYGIRQIQSREVLEAPARPGLEPGESPGSRSRPPAWPFPVGELCSCGYPQRPCSRSQTDCVAHRARPHVEVTTKGRPNES